MHNVLRYVNSTIHFGLHIKKGNGIGIEGWSDADWGRELSKRRSRSGIVITIGGNPVVWVSKLQPAVALSTAEAEFYALSECVRNIQWVRQLFEELEFKLETPTTVYQDNLGAFKWAEDVVGLWNVKHVGLR